MLKAVFFIFVRLFYRLRVFGIDNIPKNETVILESNYTSIIDPLLIAFACKMEVYFIIPQRNNKTCLFFLLWKVLKCIEEPERKDTEEYLEFLNITKKILSENKIVCFFPENQVTRNGLIGKFYDKLPYISKWNFLIKVVPVYIGPALCGKSGYEKNINRKGFVNVCFGRPLPSDIEPYKIRNAVIDLSAEVELLPRYKEKTLHYNFLTLAKTTPWRAICYEIDGARLSMFGVLLKGLLLSEIVRKYKKNSHYIGVLLPNSNAAVIAVLSVMYADLVPAILNFSMAPLVFKKAIEKSGIDLIITSRSFVDKIKLEQMPEMIFIEDIVNSTKLNQKLYCALLILFLPSFVLIRHFASKSYAKLYDPAILLFTSGSSGTPKGIILSHHNINSNVNSFINIMGIDPKTDGITGCLPLFHSFGMNICFWIPLMYGIRVVYIKNPLDIEEVLRSIKDYQLTLLATTPTILNTYIKKSSRADFKTLRLLIVGGEKFNSKDTGTIKEMTGLEPIEGFGCTELSPVVSINIAEDFGSLSRMSGKLGSVGKALPGTAVKIVNQDTWQEVPLEQKGLLFIKSSSVMNGYLSEQSTKNTIINGWYNTEDIASIDEEGYITIHGRVSRFSKIAGEMVSHELVEALIYEYLNIGERLLAVIGARDVVKGERLIVLYSNICLNPHKIIHFLLKKGLSNLWIPKAKDFIKIDEIPILGTGKVDISRLNDIFLQRINPQ